MATENDDYLVERLVPKVLAAIRAKAKAVESVPVKSDLSGITSLPAYDTTGGMFKNVLVPIDALKEPALSAGQEAQHATQQANQATERADSATASANIAAQTANEMAEAASQAAAAANEFADKIVVLTEDEYNALVASGSVDEAKIYYTYEEE